jgi:hypothetical protein
MVPGKPVAQRAIVDGEYFTSYLMYGTIGPRVEGNRHWDSLLKVGCLPARLNAAGAAMKSG